MSFTLTKQNTFPYLGVNVMMDYSKIAQEFCMEYYALYDENVEKLRKMYHANSKFVYLDHEIDGFETWLNALKHNGFYKFAHYNMNVNVIPLSDKNISINITGRMSINHRNEQRFTENIILQKDDSNSFSICTTMFQTID